MNCYNCDTLLKKEWNYCPNCKRKIKKNKNINEGAFVASSEQGKCHKCLLDLNDNWNFCPVCGTNVEFYSDKPQVSLPIIATDTDNKPAIVPVVSGDNGGVVEDKATDGKYCPKCGAKVTEEHLFCASCGTSLNKVDNVVQVNENNDVSDKNYIIWLIVTIVSTPLGFLLGNRISEELFYIGYLVSLFSIIYAKVKYPKNIAVKVVFWLFIILSVLAIIAFALIFIAFAIACGNCVESLN